MIFKFLILICLRNNYLIDFCFKILQSINFLLTLLPPARKGFARPSEKFGVGPAIISIAGFFFNFLLYKIIQILYYFILLFKILINRLNLLILIYLIFVYFFEPFSPPLKGGKKRESVSFTSYGCGRLFLNT